jgi:TIR domain
VNATFTPAPAPRKDPFTPPPTPASELSYEYDIFISYRRANAWPMFVETIFIPMFRHWLEAEMGQAPRIFFDVDELETGESWPYRLAAGVALSKVMVCLWSNEYFSSPWCTAELGHMLARRELTKQDNGPLPLILAVVIHDGENISPRLNDIQRLSIQDYANPWLARDSPRAEQLSEKIRKFCVHVYHALQKAPACDPAWSALAIDDFMQLFAQRAGLHDVPSLG